MPEHPHIVVVGAGIIGASVALHLLRGGARVTIVDAAAPGGVATRNSFAWINASWGNPEPYFRLRMRSIEEWHRLEPTIPGLRVAWTGGLTWELPPDELRRYAAEHAGWGYRIREVDRTEALRIEPGLADPPAFALHALDEGAVEPLPAAQAMLAAAATLGGRIVADTPAIALDTSSGRVRGIRTGSGPIAADEVVVAAGAGAPSLLATCGLSVPLRVLPSLMAVSAPHPRLLNGLVMTPEGEIRQDADGRLVISGSFSGDPADAADSARMRFAALQTALRSGGGLTFERHVLGYRPIPEDGFSIVGRLGATPGLYLALTHSGITLAPAIGRFAAEDLLTGRRDPLLAICAPDRFAERR